MNKIIILTLALASLFSCVSKKSAEQLQNQKDSLSVALAEKDSTLNSVFASLNDITTNLSTIKSRENIISSSLDNGELKKQPTTQIQEDITVIDELLKANHAELAKLKRSAAALKKANIKVKSLETLIAQMQAQIDDRDASIESLKAELKNAKIEVATLDRKVDDLNTTVKELNQTKSGLEDEVKTQTTLLNTAYYIVGSQKELLDQEIVYKSGFIGRTLKINEGRSLESFTKIDIRNFNELFIDKKDVTLVSSHPEGSYELIMDDKKVIQSLNILDKQKFWEYSKVLVISYK